MIPEFMIVGHLVGKKREENHDLPTRDGGNNKAIRPLTRAKFKANNNNNNNLLQVYIDKALAEANACKEFQSMGSPVHSPSFHASNSSTPRSPYQQTLLSITEEPTNPHRLEEEEEDYDGVGDGDGDGDDDGNHSAHLGPCSCTSGPLHVFKTFFLSS